MRFAKLFGTDEDQILVKKDEGESGPEVRLFFTPPGLGVYNIALTFGDHTDQASQDAAWDACEKAFDKLDEAEARRLVATFLRDLNLVEE